MLNWGLAGARPSGAEARRLIELGWDWFLRLMRATLTRRLGGLGAMVPWAGSHTATVVPSLCDGKPQESVVCNDMRSQQCDSLPSYSKRWGEGGSSVDRWSPTLSGLNRVTALQAWVIFRTFTRGCALRAPPRAITLRAFSPERSLFHVLGLKFVHQS